MPLKNWPAVLSFSVISVLPAAVYASDPAGLPVPPRGFDARDASIPHGKVDVSVSYPTRNYGMQKVTVYTPPGYSTSQKYPVVYLLHGIGGNEVAWVGGTDEGNADNVMDHLYSKQLAKPMIVVMPDGNIDGAEISRRFAAFGDVLLNDLIPWVERTYSAATDADSRAPVRPVDGRRADLQLRVPQHQRLPLHRAVFGRAQHAATNADHQGRGRAQGDVKLIFISCGSADGLKSNSDRYDTYF